MKSTLIRAGALLALTAAFSACAPLMVGGMVGGAMVATDRRTSGIQLEDEGIEIKAASLGQGKEMRKVYEFNVTIAASSGVDRP